MEVLKGLIDRLIWLTEPRRAGLVLVWVILCCQESPPANAKEIEMSTHAEELEKERASLPGMQPLGNYCQSKQNKEYLFYLSFVISIHHESMIHDWEVTKLTGGEKWQQWVD